MAEQDELPGLLRLPRELRDEIYAYIASENAVPPACPNNAGVRISDGTLRYQDPKDAIHSCYHALTKTNHQLRTEVRYYASTLRTSNCRHVAELDIMFGEDFLSFPTWIYLPLCLAREEPFDLKVHFRIFSVYTFEEYNSVRNRDGWQIGTMSAPFLDFLILLRRLVRYGPSFGPPSPPNSSSTSSLNGVPSTRSFFRLRNLSINVAYHNDTYNGGNNSNFIKCVRTLAWTGLARGAIDQIKLHWRFHNYSGSPKENEKSYIVAQEWNEDNMARAVKRGFCHTTEDSLFNGPLDNGEAVKNYEWCCG